MNWTRGAAVNSEDLNLISSPASLEAGLGLLRGLRRQLDVVDVDEGTLRHFWAPSEVNLGFQITSTAIANGRLS
jgi:hypothetical protein